MSRAGALTARIVPRIADIAADQWDACALADAAKLNPFVAHAFLKALEDAGCVGRGTGWTPSHIVVEDAFPRVTSCMPTYVKSHSQGEYVFDHGWAEAYNHAGGRYYPKLQCRRAVHASDRGRGCWCGRRGRRRARRHAHRGG